MEQAGSEEEEEEEEVVEVEPSTTRPPLAVGNSEAEDDEHGISLREWLDKPERSGEILESLHIFRQIVDMVKAAHDEGVVVGNVRPSCFVMSTFNRVSFIESVSCSCSESESEEEDGGSGEEGSRWDAEEDEEKKEVFPLKHVLGMELHWYTSPEEAAGSPGTFQSDIYRLGVLLFELLCPFGSTEEKLTNMANLRHRMLPPQFLLKWQKEASVCLWLLHPQPSSRPKMIDVLSGDFLNEPRDSLEDREAAIKLRGDIENQELLLEFLLQLQGRKQEVADGLTDTISCLSFDIEEVMKQRRLLSKYPSFLGDMDERSGLEKDDWHLLDLGINDNTEMYGSRKCFRQGVPDRTEVGATEHLPVDLSTDTQQQNGENILTKSSRLMKNFKKLESFYFQARCRKTYPVGKAHHRHVASNGFRRGSFSRTEGSSVDNFVCKQDSCGGRGWLNPFLDGLSKYLSFSRLKLQANIKQTDLLNSSNLVCSLGFDRDKEMFATAGVNRKIKIFECDAVLNEDSDIHYPVVEMVSRSKLSNICWNSYIKSQIASSDFEGVVQVWDATRSRVTVEMREHERRVWCVDFSLADPTKLASGSDDGTVKIWNTNQAGSVATLKTKACVCSVQFPPDSGYHVAVGSADHKIYYYDLRNLRIPLHMLVGHSKTVSYVKFVDSSTLVSASTDNSLKLWDLSMSAARVVDNPVQTFTGHTNVKNFVGLSISDGYIATGSETNEVFIYHKTFPMPMLTFEFNSAKSTSVREVDEASQFISCVCWRGRSSILVAANSSGYIKLLEMV